MNTTNAVATAPKTREDFRDLLERFYYQAFGLPKEADDIQEHMDITSSNTWSEQYADMVRVAKEEYDLELQ
jgi:hypothetical protein